MNPRRVVLTTNGTSLAVLVSAAASHPSPLTFAAAALSGIAGAACWARWAR